MAAGVLRSRALAGVWVPACAASLTVGDSPTPAPCRERRHCPFTKHLLRARHTFSPAISTQNNHGPATCRKGWGSPRAHCADSWWTWKSSPGLTPAFLVLLPPHAVRCQLLPSLGFYPGDVQSRGAIVVTVGRKGRELSHVTGRGGKGAGVSGGVQERRR